MKSGANEEWGYRRLGLMKVGTNSWSRFYCRGFVVLKDLLLFFSHSYCRTRFCKEKRVVNEGKKRIRRVKKG